MNKIYLNQHGDRGKLFLTMLAILFCVGLNAQNWEYVGSSSGFSAGGAGSVSTALDQDENIYVSYYDTSVSKGTVQQYSDEVWSYVGGTAGITDSYATYNSLSIDNSGNVYFTNQSSWPDSGMEVRFFDGTSWTELPKPTESGINYQTSAVSNSNILLVANGENNGTVKRYVGSTWEQVGTTGFAVGSPYFIDAVIDSNDKMYISFNNNGYVHVYENDVTADASTDWTPTGGEVNIAPASDSENYKSAITVDDNDNLYLAYVSNSAGGQKLNVKKYDGTSWTQLGTANFTTGRVQHVSIAVSADGTPYVAVSNWEDADFLKNYVVGYNESEDTWEQIGDGYISAGQATYNSLQVNSDDHLLLVFSDNGLNKLVMMEYELNSPVETPETTINPVTITSGFNHDIIANGIGDASASSDIGFDEVNSRALVSLDFQATSGSGFPTYGLPADGLINSALTSGVTFQLADYSGDNALFLTPDYVGTGTSTGALELSVENATNLYLLTAMAGGGVQYLPLNVTVNFDDSTTQAATVTVSDWYNGTGAAIQGMGRVNRANNNLEGDATNPRLYEYTIAIDEANQNKTITSLSFSFDGDQTAEWGSEIRLSLLAVSAESTEPVQSEECVFTTLSLTGFNHDVVAEGTGGDANEKATHQIDGANAFYAQDFVPTNPHFSGASAAAYGGGLPNDGYIESSATEGLMYQIADYTANNALVLRNTTSNTGTLELTEQKKAEKLYIAWVSAEGSNSVDVVVNFTDGSSQTFASQNASDWWSTNPDASTVAMGSIGRVSVITTASWAPVNSFSGLSETQLFQTEFILDEENHNKLIESVTFNKETSGNDATTTAVIALSICEMQEVQIDPVVTVTTQGDVPAEITTDNGTLQLEATVTPNAEDVTWSIVDGAEYALISNTGLVTAIGNGIVTVRAALTSDSEVYDEIEVTISNQVVAVTGLTVSVQDDAAAEITTDGGTLQLVATIAPEDATNTDLTWTITSGSEYATVDENGVVTAIANGTVTVRATSDADGTIYDEIEVVISNQVIAVIGLTVTVQDDAAAEITTDGGTLQLVATITPEDATNTDVTWTITSGSEFATVDENGVVTAIANGTVTVRATSDADGTVYDEIEVVINIPLSAEEFNKDKFSVYPNPVSDILYINTTNQVQQVKVYNMVGQEVYTGTSSNVNLQNLQAGYYIVKIQLDNNISTVKVLKQ